MTTQKKLKGRKIQRRHKEIIYIEIDSDDDKRHEKEQTKNLTEGNQMNLKENSYKKKENYTLL